ncbi:hypothetical protein [Pseudoalteromonas marina]|jgi:hypothetical protein|uniref:hypothetical protein n=1 Tax=Pseudoalteromonas marina TaxID=267375 RepID=UPI0023EF64C4|nr:hypothetical protein [Pseudoalteromonas marina]
MKKLLITIALLFSFNAKAVWLNSTGEIESVVIYTSNKILVKLKNNNGGDVVACSSKDFFAISSTYTEEARARMYSTLLAAKLAGRPVTLSYSDVSNCEAWGSSNNVYRRITRLAL